MADDGSLLRRENRRCLSLIGAAWVTLVTGGGVLAQAWQTGRGESMKGSDHSLLSRFFPLPRNTTTMVNGERIWIVNGRKKLKRA